MFGRRISSSLKFQFYIVALIEQPAVLPAGEHIRFQFYIVALIGAVVRPRPFQLRDFNSI